MFSILSPLSTMQIETTLRFYLSTVRVVKINKNKQRRPTKTAATEDSSAVDAGEEEPLFTACGKSKWGQP